MSGFSSPVFADVVWALALAFMGACSLLAWRRMDREAWPPLQWGRDGAPVMRAQRDLAVAFTPMVAAAAGLLMAAAARLDADSDPAWLITRLAAPILLAVAHAAHLRSALQTLKVEGGLKR